jgi:hypothetical protein
VQRDSPETRLEQVSVVGPQVLAKQSKETDAGRVVILVPSVQGREAVVIALFRPRRCKVITGDSPSLSHDFDPTLDFVIGRDTRDGA